MNMLHSICVGIGMGIGWKVLSYGFESIDQFISGFTRGYFHKLSPYSKPCAICGIVAPYCNCTMCEHDKTAHP